MKIFSTIALALVALWLPALAQGAPGVLDGSFGVHGSVVVEGPSGPQFRSQAPPKMALGPEGEIFVLYANAAPCTTFSDCTIEWSLARFSPDGVRDSTFGTGSGSTLTVRGNEYEPADLAVGPDGKPVVAALDQGRVVVARFDRGGHLEAMLGASDPNPLSGGAYTPPVVAVQGDGKVLVAVGSGEELRIVRYLPGGERDPGFGLGGEARASLRTRSRPAGLMLGANGSVVKLAPDGTVDGAFGKGGFSRIPMSVDDLAVDAKGRLVAGGWSGSAAVFRMRPGGGADRTFGAGVPVPLRSSGPASVALQGAGKIVALGEPCCGPKSASLYRLIGGTDHTRCLGHKATIVGTNGPDEITGTPHRDVIAALGGRDKVRALGGPDVICGGKSKDELFGGAGRNEVKP